MERKLQEFLTKCNKLQKQITCVKEELEERAKKKHCI